jgi:hypothetical protein
VTPQEKERLRIWGKGLSGDIEIRLLATQDKRSQALSKFCADLARFAPKVRVLQEEGDPHEVPAVWIGSWLRYHGLPLGTELEPFLEALSDSDQGSACIPRSVRDDLAHIKVPAELRLYVSRQCHFCPVTARQVIPLARMNESIRVTIVDCVLFPEMAQSHSIRSVPTLLLDEQFRWTGALQLEELVAVMANRNPAKLSAASLEGLLKDGRASEVAEMMIAQGSIFPAFIDLLSDEKLFVRLGAMVIMEEISGRDPELAVQVIDPLWERFRPAKDQVKGDIIYVLGESGNHEVVLRLEMVLAGSCNSQVKEAAKEALEKIYRRATPQDI